MWVVEVVVPIKKGIKCLVTVGVNYSLIKASFRRPLTGRGVSPQKVKRSKKKEQIHDCSPLAMTAHPEKD